MIPLMSLCVLIGAALGAWALDSEDDFPLVLIAIIVIVHVLSTVAAVVG